MSKFLYFPIFDWFARDVAFAVYFRSRHHCIYRVVNCNLLDYLCCQMSRIGWKKKLICTEITCSSILVLLRGGCRALDLGPVGQLAIRWGPKKGPMGPL